MAQYRSIEVDFDVHKLIELERNSFEESPNEALRRLLKLPPIPQATAAMSAPTATIKSESAPQPAVQVNRTIGSRPWIDSGVTLPHGTKLRMYYGRATFEGEVVDGTWVVEGKSYDTPSGAACTLATTRKGKKTSLNGWKYWEVRRPGETQWSLIEYVRDQAQKQH